MFYLTLVIFLEFPVMDEESDRIFKILLADIQLDMTWNLGHRRGTYPY
jgi:hypothetical protein